MTPKLYYAPGACSLAPHIVAQETGIPLDLVKVDLASHKTETGADYYSINPRGYVPALDIGQGEPLTEASVVVQYLADQKPNSGILPPAGSIERVRVQQWLAFIATELHKGFSPLFNPATPETMKPIILAQIAKRFTELDKHLSIRSYLTGEKFTVADAYAFTILNWANFLKVDLGAYAKLHDYHARIGARPAVQKALKAEGLVK